MTDILASRQVWRMDCIAQCRQPERRSARAHRWPDARWPLVIGSDTIISLLTRYPGRPTESAYGIDALPAMMRRRRQSTWRTCLARPTAMLRTARQGGDAPFRGTTIGHGYIDAPASAPMTGEFDCAAGDRGLHTAYDRLHCALLAACMPAAGQSDWRGPERPVSADR